MIDPPAEEDLEPPRKSRRGAVMIFLLGWLVLPILAAVLGELEPPWFQIAAAAVIAYVIAMVWAVVRVIRTF